MTKEKRENNKVAWVDANKQNNPPQSVRVCSVHLLSLSFISWWGREENRKTTIRTERKIQGPFWTYMMRVHLCQLSKIQQGGVAHKMRTKPLPASMTRTYWKNNHVEDKTSAIIQKELFKHGEWGRSLCQPPNNVLLPSPKGETEADIGQSVKGAQNRQQYSSVMSRSRVVIRTQNRVANYETKQCRQRNNIAGWRGPWAAPHL